VRGFGAVVECDLLHGWYISDGKVGQLIHLLIRMVHHDGECPSIGIAGVIDKASRATKMESLDVIGGGAEEVERKYVRGGLLGASVFVVFDCFGGQELTEIDVDKLAFLDWLRGPNAEAAMPGHKNLQRYGPTFLNHAIEAVLAAIAGIVTLEYLLPSAADRVDETGIQYDEAILALHIRYKGLAVCDLKTATSYICGIALCGARAAKIHWGGLDLECASANIRINKLKLAIDLPIISIVEKGERGPGREIFELAVKEALGLLCRRYDVCRIKDSRCLGYAPVELNF
jgi:hypothetical protein